MYRIHPSQAVAKHLNQRVVLRHGPRHGGGGQIGERHSDRLRGGPGGRLHRQAAAEDGRQRRGHVVRDGGFKADLRYGWEEKAQIRCGLRAISGARARAQWRAFARLMALHRGCSRWSRDKNWLPWPDRLVSWPPPSCPSGATSPAPAPHAFTCAMSFSTHPRPYTSTAALLTTAFCGSGERERSRAMDERPRLFERHLRRHCDQASV